MPAEADRPAPTSQPDPAFYARPGSRLGDWWSLLHPPYTAWHLSYVVFGAALAPRVDWLNFGLAVVAFLLAVGVSAHALDELNGRPLRTRIGSRTLWVLATACLVVAALLGVWAVERGVVAVIPLIPAGVLLAVGYNLEMFGGRLHTDLTFAAAWGGFPLLVGYLAQRPAATLPHAAVAVAGVAAATASAYAQRALSTPARELRRRVSTVSGEVVRADGRVATLDRAVLLRPLELALRALCWAMPLAALAVLLTHARS